MRKLRLAVDWACEALAVRKLELVAEEERDERLAFGHHSMAGSEEVVLEIEGFEDPRW